MWQGGPWQPRGALCELVAAIPPPPPPPLYPQTSYRNVHSSVSTLDPEVQGASEGQCGPAWTTAPHQKASLFCDDRNGGLSSGSHAGSRPPLRFTRAGAYVSITLYSLPHFCLPASTPRLHSILRKSTLFGRQTSSPLMLV